MTKSMYFPPPLHLLSTKFAKQQQQQQLYLTQKGEIVDRAYGSICPLYVAKPQYVAQSE